MKNSSSEEFEFLRELKKQENINESRKYKEIKLEKGQIFFILPITVNIKLPTKMGI